VEGADVDNCGGWVTLVEGVGRDHEVVVDSDGRSTNAGLDTVEGGSSELRFTSSCANGVCMLDVVLESRSSSENALVLQVVDEASTSPDCSVALHAHVVSSSM
jgi:hypothetical protein